MGYSRKYPHISHGRHWKSCKKCSVSMTGNPQISPKFCKFLTGILGNPFKFLRNFGIPQDFGPAGYGILQKLQLSFLEILKFLGTQFSVVHGDGGGGGACVCVSVWIFSGIAQCLCVCVWIFSGIAQHNRIIFFLKLSCLETQNETRIQLQF